jgi:polygalacturonase
MKKMLFCNCLNGKSKDNVVFDESRTMTCKKLSLLTSVVMVLVLAGGASALETLVVPQGATHTVTGKEVYDSFEVAGTLIVEKGGELTAGLGTNKPRSTIDGPEAKLVVNGGTINLNSRINVGIANNATLIMNGGLFRIGRADSNDEVGDIKLPDTIGGTQRIILNGGLLWAHRCQIKIAETDDAQIIVGGGELRLDMLGDDEPTESYVPSGWLAAGKLLLAENEGYTELVISPNTPTENYYSISAIGAKAIGPVGCHANVINIEAPFDMPALTVPVFADRSFDIRDYGAVADGRTINTKAFADAIGACSQAGGGTVIVPAGKWLTGPIHFKSNVNLHITEGAEVLFSTDYDAYLPVVLSRYEGIELYNYSPCIYANGCENIAITGGGILNGQGKAWWPWKRKCEESVKKLHEMAAAGTRVAKRIFGTVKDGIRPNFVVTINCRNVLMEGFTITNGPMWTIQPIYSENIIIRNVRFETYGPNGDGIDPDSCRNMLIENCLFDTDDDAIAIKSGRDWDGWRVNKPCENIVVRGCRFGLGKECDGVVSIGSEMSGGVRNIYIHDCTFTKTGRGVRIKSRRGRGGLVENVWLENLTMNSVGNDALLLNTFYGGGLDPTSQKAPLFRNIHVKNLVCNGTEEAIIIRGLPEMPIERVTLHNIVVKAEEGIEITDAKDVVLRGISVDHEEGPWANITNSQNITFQGATCPDKMKTLLELKGAKTKGIRLVDTEPCIKAGRIVSGDEVPVDAVTK